MKYVKVKWHSTESTHVYRSAKNETSNVTNCIHIWYRTSLHITREAADRKWKKSCDIIFIKNRNMLMTHSDMKIRKELKLQLQIYLHINLLGGHEKWKQRSWREVEAKRLEHYGAAWQRKCMAMRGRRNEGQALNGVLEKKIEEEKYAEWLKAVMAMHSIGECPCKLPRPGGG